MKFTVELEDFWLDEDESIDGALKDYIVRDVVSQIKASLKDEIDKKISEAVVKEVQDYAAKEIPILVHDGFKNAKVRKGYAGKDLKSVEEFIVDYVEDSDGRLKSEITRSIMQLSEKHAEKIKAGYDLAFATQVVANIKKQGLLKDDVSATLFKD